MNGFDIVVLVLSGAVLVLVIVLALVGSGASNPPSIASTSTTPSSGWTGGQEQ